MINLNKILQESVLQPLNKLFVYGTLKKGFSNYNRFIAPYPHTVIEVMVPRLGAMYSMGAFPIVSTNVPVKRTIYGDLIIFDSKLAPRVLDNIMRNIDMLEAYLYEKTVLPNYSILNVKTREKYNFRAYTYIAPARGAQHIRDNDLPEIQSGKWEKGNNDWL